MTKYICECDKGKTHRCTHESDGKAPVVCCVDGDESCNWRAVEEQKPELPDWCKVGAWVWHGSVDGIAFEQPYFKIERTVGELAYGKSHNNGIPVHYTYLKPARLRPWNDDELKSKVGKVFEMGNGDLTLCLGYQRDIADLIFVGKLMSAQSFAESDWKLDGSPCGVFEHYEQGEWVK